MTASSFSAMNARRGAATASTSPLRPSSPLLLSSFIQTVTPGETQQFTMSDLRPRVLTPYIIDSVRMAVYGATAPSSSDLSWRGLPKFKFTLGSKKVTDGFIPMWTFTPAKQNVTELGGYYTWVLPRPLIVSPVLTLEAEIYLSADAPGNASVYLAYAGQALDCNYPIPDQIDIPYISCWDTTKTQPPSTGFYSDPLSLYNATTEVLRVQRIVGRVQADNSTDGDDSNLLQIFNYDNIEITNGPLQIRDVFPTQSRTLPYSGSLPPNKALSVRFTDTKPSTAFQPMFSVIGVRKEAPF